jgi:hypothetical protein
VRGLFPDPPRDAYREPPASAPPVLVPLLSYHGALPCLSEAHLWSLSHVGAVHTGGQAPRVPHIRVRLVSQWAPKGVFRRSLYNYEV